MSVWNKASRFLDVIRRRGKPEDKPEQQAEPTVACCSENVHIAFRGVSDDKLYMARNRKWHEVRFYKPNGLRVFCAECRHRVL